MAAQVLIDVDGNFNKSVAQNLQLPDENCRVGAVSVVGVQGTGKSTLLNSCFSTKFPELDQRNGMAWTTKGISIAVGQSPQNAGHEVLVLDIEGTDGLDRGRKNDNAFENKTTLFALAMSNTVIFNMKCDSVNLHQGSSSPLMETVVQVMLRKFSTRRHINLLFVLRDRNMCPLEVLRLQLIKQLTEIWDRMSKAPDTVNAALEDYFKIDVLAMPHYRHEREEFNTEVVKMRERIFSMVKLGQLDSPSGFIALAERNWMDIKEDKILNLPLNRITVSEAFCVENVVEKFQMFRQDKQWLQIQREVKSGIVEGFGNDISSILVCYLLKYDEETLRLEESTRNEKRDQLTQLILKDVEPSYLSLVENMRDRSSANFQEEIVEKIRKGCSEFEKSKRDECINQFKIQLADAHIEQANWDYTHEQLGILKSKIASIEEAATYIIKIHKEIKKMKTIFWSGVTALGVTGLGALGALLSATGGLAAMSFSAACNGAAAARNGAAAAARNGAAAAARNWAAAAAAAAAAFAGTVLPTAARNGAAAGGGGGGTGLPTDSINSLIPLYGNIEKKELQLKEACKRDPTINALVNKI